RISLFDPDFLSSRIAGEVPSFEPERFLSQKDRAHVSRAVPLALAAATEALADAGLSTERMDREEKRRFGVVIGTGGGGLEFTERMYGLGPRGEDRKASVYTHPF